MHFIRSIVAMSARAFVTRVESSNITMKALYMTQSMVTIIARILERSSATTESVRTVDSGDLQGLALEIDVWNVAMSTY